MEVVLSTYKREKDEYSLKFSLNLEESSKWLRREVFCVIKLDIEGEPFI